MPSKRKKERYCDISSSSDDDVTPSLKVRSKRLSVEACVVDEDEIANNNDIDVPRLNDSEGNWYKPDVNVKSFRFEPNHFIRSHCDNEEGEASVQLWDAAFEPGNPDVIATCGGRCLCVIDVNTGELLLKYTHKNVLEIFYTLSWSQLPWGNILASGSNFGEIRLYDLARGVSFHAWTYKKGVSINAVAFQDDNPNHLFTASNDCSVNLWNIGQPSPPLFEDVDFTNVLRVQCPGEGIDIYSMAYIKQSGWIMVGCTDGLFGSQIPNSSQSMSTSGGLMTEFKIPGRVINNFQYPYIDSVCSLGNNLVAAKRINQGRIIVFRPPLEEEKDQRFIEVEVLAELAWRKTENFYMNIGCCVESGMLACGDDKGYVWVYKLPSWMTTDNEEKEDKISSNCPIKMAPLGIVPWPVIEDDNANNGGTAKDVIVDKVTLSPNGKHIVAVTNNNLVAIWKKS